MTTLRDLPDEQFFCLRGADGHDWDTVNRPQRYEQWGIRVNKRCTRCRMELELVWSHIGVLEARWYTRPQWHLKVTEPYDTADVRVEYVRRKRSRAGRKPSLTLVEGAS